MRKLHSIFTSVLTALIFCYTTTAQHKIFVANGGDDSNKGTISKPLKTLDRAFQQVLEFREKGYAEVIEIFIREGRYNFHQAIKLDSNYSNIRISAYKNEAVSFFGGVSIPVNAIKSVKLDGVPDTVLAINLKAYGLDDYGNIRSVGFARPYGASWAELFVNKKPFHLSRWPNKGMIPIEEVLDKGSVPRNDDFSNLGGKFRYDSLRVDPWKYESDPWIAGYFMWGYADDMVSVKEINDTERTITTKIPTLYGFGDQKPWRKWYGVNILRELDANGEYYIDRSRGMLYFRSEEDVKQVEISVLEDPFFQIEGVKNVAVKGITFECSRSLGIAMDATENVTIENCVFKNLGSLGITVGQGITPFKKYRHEGTGTATSGLVGSLQQHLYVNTTFNRLAGTNNMIRGCVFYQLGAGGVSLGGGDRLSLAPGNNIVENCEFYDLNRIEKSYRPAVHLTGVGNKVRHCEMYDLPSMAILMHGNNHLIEYNYIHDVCLEVEDQGAVYYGRDPSERGSVIRYNYFKDIPDHYNTCAVYHDDGACGLKVQSNVFYKAGKWNVLIGGGSDNAYINNLFVDTKFGIHIDNRLENWSKGLLDEEGLYYKRLMAVHYDQPPYSEAYPELSRYFEDKPSIPKRNILKDNSFVNMEESILDGNKEWLDMDASNELMNQESVPIDTFEQEVFKLAKLKGIAIDSIGLYKN
ncbi:right-handed parallel beta-helix repeat-containing protein [Zhouia amylolytica]|uniref:right-handed parallel beta-helix repeat-containing protein n=1 Tax=Zhouia amylolytica TaxID=376730 RepID=UPI0020CCAB0C|nr:right-handed parallel beta-helix repeat-containing protein [Zhouia amylolytica]MCQ0112622.1 right-handed parallel beta-helix repeat-containing protein [Zhouia amylolytica]